MYSWPSCLNSVEKWLFLRESAATAGQGVSSAAGNWRPCCPHRRKADVLLLLLQHSMRLTAPTPASIAPAAPEEHGQLVGSQPLLQRHQPVVSELAGVAIQKLLHQQRLSHSRLARGSGIACPS